MAISPIATFDGSTIVRRRSVKPVFNRSHPRCTYGPTSSRNCFTVGGALLVSRWRGFARRDQQLFRHSILAGIGSAVRVSTPCLITVVTLYATAASAEPVKRSHLTVAEFACESTSVLEVRLTSQVAHVRIDGRQFALERRASSLGAKYSSRQGTLIVDGSFASFVTSGALSGRRCWTPDNLAVYVP